MAYKNATSRDIKAMLGSRILPFFQQQKIALDIKENHQSSECFHLVELPRPTFTEIMSNAPRNLKYLNSPELNIRTDCFNNTSYSKALKGADYYINETFAIRVENLKYHRLLKSLTHGIVSKKVYEAIGITQPVEITYNGKTIPVASLSTRIYLPESVCRDLKNKYVGKYPDNAILKLSVNGPATVFGGYTEGQFMKFYCLDYYLEIYAENYKIEII